MKRLLITGSIGFIGRHAVRDARERDWTAIPFQGSFMGQDIRTTPIPRFGLDAILHLAAFSSNAGFADKMAGNYNINVTGFHRVLRVAMATGARLLYASSSAVYQDYRLTTPSSGEEWSDSESDPIYAHSNKSHYGRSKLINEMMAESYRTIGLNALGLRIFNAYGPGDELKPVGRQAPMTWMQAAKREGKPAVIYGDGTQAKDFIHISDVVEIIMRLLESDAQGIVNVGTGVATSFDALAGLIGCEREYRPIPDPASYQFYTRADTSRLLSIIGPYKFKTVEEGLTL